MNDFKKYLSSFREIVFSSLNIIFWIIDFMFYFFSAIQKSFDLPTSFYIAVLIVGFLISAVKKNADKNSQISEYKSEIPMLGLYLRRNEIRDGKKVSLLRVRNLWTKPIKDIHIESIKFGGKLVILTFKLDDTNILKPDEERDLIHDSDTNIGRNLIFPASIDPKYANTNSTMTVTFKDSQNNKYKNAFNLGIDGIFIKESSRII